MANGTRPPAGIGCLGTVVGGIVLVAVVLVVALVGFVALVVVAALVVVGLLVLAVDRLLLALSPKRRERRERQRGERLARFGRFGPLGPGPVIDTTATEEPGHPPGRRPDGPEDELGPG